MKQLVKEVLFTLIRSQIKGTELNVDVKNLITLENLPLLYKVAKKHDLAHLICQALEKNGLLADGGEVKTYFEKERNMAIFRYTQMQYELEQICKTLDDAKISYIPLKGSVIRAFYPEPWMRTSCDIDVLVKKEDLENAIETLKTKLEFTCEKIGGHDAQMYSPIGVHLELHYKLNSNSPLEEGVLSQVWSHVKSFDNPHCEMTEEMFYFYHIAHMAGHFKVGGCGIRTFLDLYLLRKNLTYNDEKLRDLLKAGGLEAFFDAVCAVADFWFGDCEKTPLIAEIENYILNAGMYGDMKHRVAIQQKERGGSARYLLSRIFMPYSQLKFVYPRLQKHPILFPFYQVKRWCNLLKKDSRKNSINELKETLNGDEEKKKRVTQLLKDLEL